MFCSNCRNPLSDTDKFCSNCGTPVEKTEKTDDLLFKDEVVGNLQEEDSEIKIEPPTEKFDWNVHTFPGAEPGPTEEIDFDWHMDEDQRTRKGQEIAFAPEPPVSEPPSRETGRFATPAFLKVEKPVEKPEVPVKEELYTEAPKMQEEPVAAFEKVPEPPAQERKAGLGAPVFIGVGPKLGATQERKAGSGSPAFVGVGPKLEVLEEQKTWEKKEEPLPEEKEPVVTAPAEEVSQELYSGWTFEGSVPPQDEVVGPKMWTPDAPVIKPMPGGEEKKVIQGEELEREIFENVETPDNPTLARQTAKIDKFYTFNKKNEEFQKLLDKEYEKFKGGREEKAETFGTDVDALRRDGEALEDGMPMIKADSQVEEMAKARELFFSDDVEEEDLAGMGEDPKVADVEEKAQVVEPEEKPEVATTQMTEDEKNAEAFWSEGEDQQADLPDKKEKSGKAGTVVIVILSVILTLLIILLAIRFFAPESPAAKKMDEITNKVFSVFQGGDNTATAADSDAKTPKEDKTGLIQLELGKNQDGAIETIRYNSSLAFDETMDYGNRDINESKKLTENKWYTGGDNKEHYYDRGLVGTIIAHVSKAAVENKEEGILKTLDIGEFRKGEKGFYVWVAEYMESEDGGQTTNKKIYLVTVSGEAMEVTESYNL